MNKQALYFPYIRVPEAAWFTRTLLYWDRVGTIVPYALADSRERLGDYTFELIGAHLVEPVYPDAHLGMIPRFAEGFFELLATDTVGAEERRVGFERGDLTLIHFDKMGKTIADELESRGLAHSADRTDSPNSWWNVESRTADIFMTYLATTLGAIEGLNMDPITDAGDLLVQPNTSSVRRAEALRLGVLESVLPGPATGVPAKEIVDFKERYKDRLGAFRTHVEEELLAIALIEEQDARLRKRQLVEERLRGEIDEIVARMRERRWPKIVFGTVCGIAAVGVAAIGAVTTGGVAVALAVPGLVSAAYAAIEGAPKRDVSRSPVAYAALAEKYFGRH